jgi:hypothetical protein
MESMLSELKSINGHHKIKLICSRDTFCGTCGCVKNLFGKTPLKLEIYLQTAGKDKNHVSKQFSHLLRNQ